MKNKRVHVSFDDETIEILEIISNKEKRPLSEVVRRITENWMESYEDTHWGGMATKEMLEDDGERMSSEELFGELCTK